MTATTIILRFIFGVYGLWQILRVLHYIGGYAPSRLVFFKSFWIVLSSFIFYYAADIAEWLCR